MPKLIDAEAAKAAIEALRFRYDHIGGDGEGWYSGCMDAIDLSLSALDALPDASKKAIHAERIPVPPHLAEAQRVVIRQAQQAGDGAEEK